MRAARVRRAALLLAAVLAALSAASCAARAEEDDGILGVLFVTDGVTENDGSYCASITEGIKAAESFAEVDGEVLAVGSLPEGSDVMGLIEAAGRSADVWVFAGEGMAERVGELQYRRPDTVYVCVDFVPVRDGVEDIAANTVCISFREQEAGFEAGAAAALELREGEAGVILGRTSVGAVLRYAAGFEQGIEYANRDRGTNVSLSAENMIEIDSFTDIAACRRAAAELYDGGVSVVFPVCGGASVGALAEAEVLAARGVRAFAVGVDSDRFGDGEYEPQKSVVLTSAVKQCGEEVNAVLRAVVDGTFEGGGVIFGGAGLPDENPNLSAGTMRTVREIRSLIQTGALTVDEYTARFSPER